MAGKTPLMGWNSWNTFGADINEELIKNTADKMVELGLLELGYNYLIIDDCWSLKERDENGRLVADPEKFPNGMKAVADYVHSKGLKFGMYSCAGHMTCAGYPGSYEYEFIDAETFASWEVDYLKYDYCFRSGIIPGRLSFRTMGLALKNSGRDILFSACTWGKDETPTWVRETGAGMWRSTGDIFDSWESVCDLVSRQEDILAYGGNGCYNDMDMLTVGMYGKGNVALGGMSDLQYKAHFSLWALFGSPLVIGCDINNMSDEAYKILTNKKLIEIDQDAESNQVIPLKNIWNGDNLKCYARILSNGDIAIGLFNLGDKGGSIRFNIDELGLFAGTGKTLVMEEVWTGEEITVKNGNYAKRLEAYECQVFRARLANRDK